MAPGPPVELRRDPQADLIPRFDGRSLAIVPSRIRRDEPIVGGLVAGQAVLDVDGTGALAGMSVLEERRQWPKGTVSWEFPRGTPHRLLIDGRDGGFAEVRWDGERKLFAVVWDDTPDAELFALGPRAWAATAGGRLVGLLADLRGFDRA